jgi:hypothetical protein
MTGASERIEAAGIAVQFDPSCGIVERLVVVDEGREVAPLHRAPWVGSDEVLPEGTSPHLARLAGDFLCAPFASREGDSPQHGWTANTPWAVVAQGPGHLRAALTRPVHGATVVKELRVEDGHPFLYQRHVFVGGAGRVPVANHANVALPRGGVIRTSPKAGWETPAAAPEPDRARGRSRLAYPARASDPRSFPAEGGTADLTRYPFFDRSEEFVVGVEAPGHRLGWTAVARPHEGDLFLSLRDARALPMTMLWQSNGGRDYPPWSGRHFGCLGVEEGAAAHMLGVSTEANLAGPGTLALDPLGVAEVRHVVGAVAWPSGEAVADVRDEGDAIVVHGEGGATRRVPVLAAFLGADG